MAQGEGFAGRGLKLQQIESEWQIEPEFTVIREDQTSLN